MPKFKRGHNFGYKAENVPYNKENKGEMEKVVPVPYIRLSDQMFNMVSETPSTSEREKMVLWHGCYHLLHLRGSKLKKTFQNA